MRKIVTVKDCMKTFEGDGIPVTRAFPVPEMRENDPFLLFDHFGPINYEPGGATGVPAHPHCGFEAITYLSLIHISEPTRLRRISYAVFCLKK